MTVIWVALIAAVFGGLAGFGFAVWWFGIDTNCQERIATAWEEGWVHSYDMERGAFGHEAGGPIPSHLIYDLPVWNPYRPDETESPDDW